MSIDINLRGEGKNWRSAGQSDLGSAICAYDKIGKDNIPQAELSPERLNPGLFVPRII